LVRGGQTPEELARKFGPSANAIRNWVVQAARDEGRRADGLTRDEKEELRRLRREVRALREERGDSEKSHGLVRQGDHVDPVAGFEFGKGDRPDYAIATMCRVLGVFPSGYYAWQHRVPSGRTQPDAELPMQIHTIHLESPGDLRGAAGAGRTGRAGRESAQVGHHYDP
jgi:hypothetical protein